MKRSDSLRRLFRIGLAGFPTALLAASIAEASLPTGGMLLPRPQGPARGDLPAPTSIDSYRIPSAVAYGMTDGRRLPSDGVPDEGVSHRKTRYAAEAPSVVGRPAVRSRAAALAQRRDHIGLPEPPAASGIVERNPYDEINTDFAMVPQDSRPPVSVPPDAWETGPVSTESAVAYYAGLNGICPVTLREERRVVTSRPELFSEFEGRRYEFATPEAKAAFDIDPERYAPVLGGRDVVLTSLGAEDAVGSLKYAGFYRERLYLFQAESTFHAFYDNPRRYAVGE